MSGVPLTLDPAAGKRLEAYLHNHIPLVRHMQLRVENWNDSGLTLGAPLLPNINHEGTAFGGSLESLAMLACWGLVWLLLENEPTLHIVVAESSMRFLRPVSSTLNAHCAIPDESTRRNFFAMRHRRHKARIKLQARIVQENVLYTEFSGQFVAWQEKPHA